MLSDEIDDLGAHGVDLLGRAKRVVGGGSVEPGRGAAARWRRWRPVLPVSPVALLVATPPVAAGAGLGAGQERLQRSPLCVSGPGSSPVSASTRTRRTPGGVRNGVAGASSSAAASMTSIKIGRATLAPVLVAAEIARLVEADVDADHQIGR